MFAANKPPVVRPHNETTYHSWSDEWQHLLALQAKLNAYFDFVQSGQIFEVRPEALRK
jgi:hypothetical protein